MTDMPPSRFRVVERGRRLEVIDTHAGKTPTPPRSERPPAISNKGKPGLSLPAFQLPKTLRFDGGGSWATDSFYDAKGPRTLTLDAGAMQKLRLAGAWLVALIVIWAVVGAFLPILWGAPMLLFNPKMRETVRNQATLFLDGLDSSG